MEFGLESSTRLSWRHSPELLLNEESLAEVIVKLRAQVQTLEKHELLSGTTLPPWLVKALSEVANSSDAVIECHALRDQVVSLQKEVLDLRHEILLQQSASTGSTSQGYSPTPYHRQSTGRMRLNQTGPSIRPGLSSTPSQRDMSAEYAAEPSPSPTKGPDPATFPQINVEGMLKPLWDAIHRQTNDFATVRQAFQDAKDTVSRLQAEIKRRDALVQARNNKHEGIVQTQMDKLNESLRACVTQNDLIGAEQRISQQMKIDRQRMLDEVEDRSSKIVEDLLTSRSEQEDINSTHAEMLETMTRKQSRAEELIVELRKKQQDTDMQAEAMQSTLNETVTKLDANTTAVSEMAENVKSFEETQNVVAQHSNRLDNMQRAHEELKTYLEHRIGEKIADSVVMLRGEIATVDAAVQDLICLNLDSEIKSVAGKLDMVALTVADSVRKIAAIQKQATATDDHNRSQFIQVFDSIDRIQHSMSTLSEESIRISYGLQKAMENADMFSCEMNEYRASNDHNVEALQKDTRGLQADLERYSKTVDNELGVIKNQLFHIEEVTSTHKREIEETQREVERNFRSQYQENKMMQGSLESLHTAKEELSARQDRAESQMIVLQAENRAEIQAATNRLVAIVDKESDRVEALYMSFQKKQDDFAEVVARSSIRNMDLVDLNREIDRVCESFVSECWKFETSARSSNKASARGPDSNSSSNNMNLSGRKLFNERQQQLLTKNCQFIADLVVARTEYEVLHTGCNKDVKNQNNMEELMIDQQSTVLDKVRVKIYTKIMNNKNIGEQFDKTALDRRELYIDTVNNMLAASLKRRTMTGAGRQESKNNLQDGSLGGILGGDFLETQRLVGIASASGGTSRMNSAQNSRQSVSYTPSGISSEQTSRLATFSPSTNSVLRAGFRLPKGSSPASMRKSLASPLATTSVNEMEDELGDTFAAAAIDALGGGQLAASNHTLGWGADGQDAAASGDSGLSKSYSLPALKQQ